MTKTIREEGVGFKMWSEVTKDEFHPKLKGMIYAQYIKTTEL